MVVNSHPHLVDAFEEAKKHSLTAFLEDNLGVSATKESSGGKRRMDSCPSCGPPSQSKQKLVIFCDASWHCHGCEHGGSIVDAALYLGYGSTPLEAAKYVADGGGATCQRTPQEAREAKQKQANDVAIARTEVVKRLFQATRDYASVEVKRYLMDERCFTTKFIKEAHARGIIGTLPSYREGGLEFIKHYVGLDLMIQAGIYNQETGKSWLASYPLMQFMPGHVFAEVRRIWMPPPKEGFDAPSKTLGLGFCQTGQAPYYWDGNRDRCLVTEGFMDLGASITMGYPHCGIAVPGISKWDIEWFVSLQQSGVKVFDLAYDNDLTSERNRGQEAQKILSDALSARGIPWANASPAEGDLNDFLRKKVRASTVAVT
jgi:hypothetical protein